MCYYKVISFSDKEMILFEKAVIPKKGEIVIGENRDRTMTLRLIE